MTPFELFAASALGASLLALVGWLFEGRRRTALKAAAGRLGLFFSARSDTLLQEPFAKLPVFLEGQQQRVSNVASRDGLHLFELSVSRRGRKNRVTDVQTVGAIRVAGAELPRFATRPARARRSLRDDPRSRPGPGIAFPEDEAFGQAIRVEASNEQAVRALLSPELRRELLEEPSFCVEAEGDWLLAFEHRRRLKPDALADFVAKLESLARHFERRY